MEKVLVALQVDYFSSTTAQRAERILSAWRTEVPEGVELGLSARELIADMIILGASAQQMTEALEARL